MDEDVSAFASDFNRFLHAMSAAAATTQESPVRDLLDRHLGDRSEVLPVVAEGYASYDHVNLQVALDAYAGAKGRTAELIGLSGQQRRWMSLSDLVATAHHQGVEIGRVDLGEPARGSRGHARLRRVRPVPDRRSRNQARRARAGCR